MVKVKELAQEEKETRRARLKTRMLWILIGVDILLFGYAVVEAILLVTSLIK